MHLSEGKVAVVTGAASGIGLALAQRFARSGMKVVLADVEETRLEEAVASASSLGAEAVGVPTDVSDQASVEALAARAMERFGAVHVLCNNAGVAGDGFPVWEQTVESWTWVLGVNLWGVIHGLRTFVPRMLEQGGEGHIVNTASMAGHLSMPFLATYNASKFAVVTISECLYHELQMTGAPLRVSVLCPGFVRTRIIDAERNRPPELRDDARTSEAAQAFRAAVRGLVDAGTPPEAVAERVVDAIRAERFWIFPHPEMLDAVRARMENVLAQENPTFAPPPGVDLKL